RLNVFVFGEGSAGELGLGTAKNAIDVKRPRLNPLLPSDSVGIVDIAAGGMHCIALTHDNKILTWGVNDQGALGRGTEWEGGLRDVDDEKEDSDSDDEDADSGLNPRESTPTAISMEHFPEGTVFTKVVAGDSNSFAITDEGKVYGWGTFRSNEGVFGFSRLPNGSINLVQKTPMLLHELKKIITLECGANHVLALDVNGNVFAWGSGQQNQLGRRIIERRLADGLDPHHVALPNKKVTAIGVGAYHSFAIDKQDNVWSWGLNSYGETGIDQDVGADAASIIKPEKVRNLCGKGVTLVNGGAHHSVAVTQKGELLIFGRMDGGQTGIPTDQLPLDDEEAVKKDEQGKPRILLRPTVVPNIDAAYAATGTEHTIAVTKDGKAYSWGFNSNYQCGLGTDDDIEVATHIDNTAVRGKHLTFAAAGGQFSLLAAPVEEAVTNGVGAEGSGDAMDVSA
ncbi:hypothetical protein LTS18_013320, partial [Coniosporium uncinatum]